MVTIGNDTLPGTITTVESADTQGANIGAPGTPVLLGQADLPDGTANADEMYRVTRSNRARELFGEPANSMLTRAVQNALVEGAYPVFAVAAAEDSISGEDLSGVTGDTTTVAETPVKENADDITFTVNSTEKTTVLYYDGDPENASPGTDEVLFNPQSGKAKADEEFGNTGDDVDYVHVNYTDTFDVVDTAVIADQYVREVVDFIAPVDENETVVNDAHTKSTAMEEEGWFNIVLAGAGQPYIVDEETQTDETADYTNPFDSSRIQLINPSRDGDGNTVIGNYVGRRSALGVDAFPIYKRLQSVSELQRTLRRSERENLVNAKVIPLEEMRSGVRIVEDLTTVTSDNNEEAAWQRGYARLLTDFVTTQSNERADPFIGDFNERSSRNTFRANLSSDLKALLETGQIQAYSLVVEEGDDSTEVIADIGINPADPIVNIRLTVAAGDVTNGVTAEVVEE